MKTKIKNKWVATKPMYLSPRDKRYNQYSKQLKKYGFCDSETWSLDATISEFILPRLKRFKEINNGYPGNLSEKKWNEILDKMIFAFEWDILCDESESYNLSKSEIEIKWKRYEEGMNLFAKWFRGLWW